MSKVFNINDYKKAVRLKESTIKELKLNLNKEIKSLKELRAQFRRNTAKARAAKVNIPQTYSDTLKWQQKIIYCIHKLEKPNLADITKEICRIEMHLKYAFVYPKIQQAIIRLQLNNAIIKVGNYKSRYKIRS